MAKRAGNSTQSKGKRSRKHGRNIEFCKMYKDTGRRILNKITKLVRHIKNMPNDLKSKQALERLNSHENMLYTRRASS